MEEFHREEGLDGDHRAVGLDGMEEGEADEGVPVEVAAALTAAVEVVSVDERHEGVVMDTGSWLPR